MPPHHQPQISKLHPQGDAKNRDSLRYIAVETNKAYMRSLQTASLKDSGAKEFKKEASSSSHSGLHIEGSFMDQGKGQGGLRIKTQQESWNLTESISKHMGHLLQDIHPITNL